uniref:Uncharacterized protein n=1 Tax=Anguilla anguilla TaxID=7936 RepID=A0A0E9PWW6_ANGAN
MHNTGTTELSTKRSYQKLYFFFITYKFPGLHRPLANEIPKVIWKMSRDSGHCGNLSSQM